MHEARSTGGLALSISAAAARSSSGEDRPALDCLRSDARTAAKAGVPAIYAAFFPPRPATTTCKAAANSPPTTETPPAPTPPETKTSDAA